MDTGAEVTALTEEALNQLGAIQRAEGILQGSLWGRQDPPQRLGSNHIHLNLQGSLKSCSQEMYVIKQLKHNLLGLPANRVLGLLTHADEVNKEVYSKFPNLFTGLGTFEGDSEIRHHPDVQPFAANTPITSLYHSARR